MYSKDIQAVKDELAVLRQEGLVKEWELPYENLFTRLSAAIFFLTPVESIPDAESLIWARLGRYEDFSHRLNTETRLSGLRYRITFNAEEAKKKSGSMFDYRYLT